MMMKIVKKAKELYRKFVLDGFVVYLIFVHAKTPWHIRLLVLVPVAYILNPIDFISDLIPVVGQVDDLAVARYGYFLVFKLVPKDILEECRRKAEAGLSPGTGKAFRRVAAIVSITFLLVLFGGIYVAKKLSRKK